LADRVVFTGPRYGPDRLAALADADVVALPSAHEIFGLAAFEALMCGAPVVVADDCGAGRILDEAGAGYLTPYGDVAALAAALLRALTRREEALCQVAAGQAYVRRNLDWAAVIDRLEGLYREVAG
jgi:glycogen(starch) synthase